MIFAQRYRSLVAEVGRAVQHRADELKAVAGLAGLIEREQFDQRPAAGPAGRPQVPGRDARAGASCELCRRVEWFESRRNPFYALMSAPLLVTTQLAFAIEAWRSRHGRAAARWLETIGELEALASLATYAFEHPGLPFPELVPDEEGPRFEGRALAHPLLPEASRVANDVSLDPVAAAVAGDRIEHVGQEHAPADGGDGRRDGPGRSARSSPSACASPIWRSGPRCARATRCRRGSPASSPRSSGCAASSP